jgi:hypothetical protein
MMSNASQYVAVDVAKAMLDIARDRGHRRQFRTVIGTVIVNHPHCTLTDLKRKLVGRLAQVGSFSQGGASGKPGTVQSARYLRQFRKPRQRVVDRRPCRRAIQKHTHLGLVLIGIIEATNGDSDRAGHIRRRSAQWRSTIRAKAATHFSTAAADDFEIPHPALDQLEGVLRDKQQRGHGGTARALAIAAITMVGKERDILIEFIKNRATSTSPSKLGNHRRYSIVIVFHCEPYMIRFLWVELLPRICDRSHARQPSWPGALLGHRFTVAADTS